MLRSGSDFKQLSYLEARRSTSPDRRWDIDVWRRDAVKAVPEDAETLALVDKLTSKLKKSLEKQIGWTAAPLDARFVTVRLRESNLGNFVCDIMRHHYGAECALMAAGTIRGDQVYAPGPIRVKDVTDCFPFEDPVIVMKVAGAALWDALENGVSLYPALEGMSTLRCVCVLGMPEADDATGRFPQVSNIQFTFDASKPPGQRIVEVEVCGTPLDRERVYTMATRGYMGRGKDGYDSLLVQPEGGKCEEVVSEENGMLISAMLRQYFMSLKVMGQWTGWGPSLARHWNRVAGDVGKSHPNIESPVSSPVHEKAPSGGWLEASRPGMPQRKQSWAEWTPEKLRAMRGNVEPLDESGDEDDDNDSSDGEKAEAQAEVRNIDRELEVMRRVFHKWCRLAGVRGEACDSLTVAEIACGWAKAIAPRVEGRIRIVGGKAG